MRVLYALDEPGPLADLVARVRARVGAPQPRVAASLLFQGYAARLWSPLLATAVSAHLTPVLHPSELYWRYVDGQPLDLWLPHPAGWPPDDRSVDADRVYRTVVAGHLDPLARALREVVSVSPRVLWGNAASALAGAAGMIGSGDADELVDRLLTRGVLRGTGTWERHCEGGRRAFRRRSCCLYYRVPGGGTCGDCVLTDR